MLIPVVEGMLLLLALGLLVPALVLALECAAAGLRPRPLPGAQGGARPRVAVVVPARDEAAEIGACLATLVPQLAPRDRLLVVADDCHDATAAIARAAGATVLERREPARPGKGYALAHAVTALAADPPAVVLVVDADCRAGAGLVERTSRAACATGRPVQGAYVLRPPADPGPGDLLSALAVVVRNVVRPRGLARLGLPCLLTGSGMALPWGLLRAVRLASGHGSEDIELALACAEAGHPPLFCGDAGVEGRLPQAPEAARSQRRRWEHGHLDLLVRRGPALLLAAMRARRLDVLALALDLCVPPLALFVLLWAGACAAALAVGWLTGRWLPLVVLALAGGAAAAALGLAWAGFGRALAPVSTVRAIPGYVLRKLPLYAAALTRRQTGWAARRRGSTER